MKCFGASGLSPDWSVHTKKNGVLVSSIGVLSKGHVREGGRDSASQGHWGSPVRSLQLLVTLPVVYLRPAHGRGWRLSKALKLAQPHE